MGNESPTGITHWIIGIGVCVWTEAKLSVSDTVFLYRFSAKK